MTGRRAEDLRHAALTYAEQGQTRGDLPTGYHHLRRSVVVGTGRDRFDQVARTLLSWEIHRRAGLVVRPSSESVVEDAVAVLRLGRRQLSLAAPVRVVYLVDEPRRKGFAYGTLPGHPESGEEAFVVELRGNGEVIFTITAFSRPATLAARAGGPVTRAIQSWVMARYLRAV